MATCKFIKTRIKNNLKSAWQFIANVTSNVLNAYFDILCSKVQVNGRTNLTVTRIWRFIAASPVIFVIGWLLYWICTAWQWFVDMVNYVYWGIGA